MAIVQAYTKAGVDAKINSRSNMTLIHTGGGTPDIAAYPDAKTGDVIERSGDGARWSVLARNLNPVEGRVVSVAGKSGIVTLTPSDVGAAPSSHTHTKAQITDLNASDTATANSMAQRDSGGRLVVATPTTTTHATTKAYVDSAITGAKAWGNLTGVPSTFTPSAHTHTVSNITDLTLTTSATANTTPLRDSEGRFEVANPSTATQVANKSYVDSAVSAGTTWANTSGKPSTFPPSTHNHTKAQITDLNASTEAGANTIAQRDSAGRLTVVAPTLDTQAATKKYVDDTVTAGATWGSLSGKPSAFPPESHTHTVAQITDLTLATAATANTVVQRDTSGRITIATPTSTTHATTKAYVDSAVAGAKVWGNLTGVPSTFAPSAHTHSASQITDLDAKLNAYKFRSSNIDDSVRYIAGNSLYAGRLIALDDSGRLGAEDPSSTTDVANKRYVDSAVSNGTTWANTSGKPTTFPPSSHTHTKAQITDLNASETATANSIAQRDSSGRITVATPTSTTHATTKAYVDNAITGAKAWENLTGKPSSFPPSSHNHTVSQITDLTLSTILAPDTVVQRSDKNQVRVALAPEWPEDATSKRYVDNSISSHNHTVSQITDLHLSTISTPDTVVQRSDTKQVRVALAPEWPEDAASKVYVDNSITNKMPWYGTQTQYDAITTKDPDRLYIIAYF